MAHLRIFGLIGFPLGHSFSKRYYDLKIEKEGLSDIQYELFSLPELKEFPALILNTSGLQGVNVTIPHKIAILPYLDSLSAEAQKIGAVNCVKIFRNEQGLVDKPFQLKGFNTDVFGFVESLKPLLDAREGVADYKSDIQALVLGDGGAAKAVHYGLQSLKIPFISVSRNPKKDLDFHQISYLDLTPKIMREHQLIVNTTPLGTFPNEEACPDISFDNIGKDHILYDLVYNPAITLFLQKGLDRGAVIKNGYEMLELQAEKNWDIWLNST